MSMCNFIICNIHVRWLPRDGDTKGWGAYSKKLAKIAEWGPWLRRDEGQVLPYQKSAHYSSAGSSIHVLRIGSRGWDGGDKSRCMMGWAPVWGTGVSPIQMRPRIAEVDSRRNSKMYGSLCKAKNMGKSNTNLGEKKSQVRLGQPDSDEAKDCWSGLS